MFFKIPRYSYLLSYRCLGFITQEVKDDVIKITDLDKFKENKFVLNFYFDMLTLDEHLQESNKNNLC